jgi:hypothetical protein
MSSSLEISFHIALLYSEAWIIVREMWLAIGKLGSSELK